MDQHHSDNLPPELDELGQRMSTERPVASDRVLDRVMTRAQGARGARKSSLMWRSSAPRARKKSVALGTAGILALAGTTGLAVTGAGAVNGHVDSPAAACADNPPVFASVNARVGRLLSGTELRVPGVLGNRPVVVLQSDRRVGNRIRLQVCLVA